MRLRRGLPVLQTGVGRVQLGLDPRWAVRLHGLSRSQCTALGHGAERSLRPALPEPVLAELDRLGLIHPSGVGEARVPARLTADCRGSALADGGDPRGVRERRAAAVVQISGLSRTGVVLALTLAGAGVGTVLLDDPRLVRAEDVGAGLGPEAVGRRRHTAVGWLVREIAPGARTGSPGRWEPDLVITVDAGASDPEQALRLMSAGRPQLPVVLREADALVGPWAAPGVSPCLRCVDLARADLDPDWPRLLGLLCTERWREQVGAEPVALATVAGGLAAAEALTWVDGGQPVTLGRQYELALPSVEPRLRTWAAHPECGCAALPTGFEVMTD